MLRNYSSLSDTELDSIVSEITSLFSRSGEKMISVNFKSCGVLIQRESEGVFTKRGSIWYKRTLP